MYHYVHKKDDPEIFRNLKGVSTEIFEEQINYLLKHFTPIKHQDLENHFLKGDTLPKNSFYLTFDDGFKQHITNVLPILKKYNLEGSFFIPTMPLKEKKLHFIERQRVCQYSIKDKYIDFLQLFYNSSKVHLPSSIVENIKPSLENINKAKEYLKQYSFYTKEERFYRYIRDELLDKKTIEAIIDTIFNNHFVEENFINEYYMDKDDIHTLYSHNMIIGGHSHTHPFLERLKINDIEIEIQKSLNILESITHEPIKTFSYPYGTYNQDVIDILKKNSIYYSFTTKDKLNLSLNSKYEIMRIDAVNFDKKLKNDTYK